MRVFLKRLFSGKKAREGRPVAEVAGELFNGGRNCCESVLLAHLGDVDAQIVEMAKAFGGGIGGSKCLCGAVTGGVMVLGLKGKKGLAGRLVARFREQNKVTCCKVLSAPYVWKSPEHHANCRRLTMEVAAELEALLRS